MVKNLAAKQEVGSQGWEDSPGEGNCNPVIILAWEIPWTEEPCRVQSVGSQKNKTRFRD